MVEVARVARERGGPDGADGGDVADAEAVSANGASPDDEQLALLGVEEDETD